MKTKISSLKPALLNDHQYTDLLYNGLDDDNQPGECIFVPGSSKAVDYRLPKALELYRQGRSKKILFSGGVIWDGNLITEAETLKVKALEEGVTDQDILTETQSLHTKENVLASLLILDRAIGLHHMNNLIVVTAPYHLRRMQLTLKTYMPAWITYSLVAANDKTTRKENWHLNPYGRKRVETEAAKLIHYVKKGIIMDDIVEIAGIGKD